MRPLALGLALVAVAAVPASAARPTPPTECAAVLTAADNGAWAGCTTLGNPNIPGAGDHARTLRLTVLYGKATATLTCNDGSDPVTVTMDGTGTGATTLDGSGYCWVDLYATAPNTTAIATNTSAYVLR